VPVPDPWVTLPRRIVGPSLSAAGLAAWVLSKNDREQEAATTRELQEALDAALRSGNVDALRVSRTTVEGAASVWATAAALLESWSDSVGGDSEADRDAVRLRRRARSLRLALDAR
jgi:hypothetical protein